MLQNNQEITEEMKEEIKKIPRNKWQWKPDNWKPMICSKSSSKREVYSNKFLPQETRKISNKQLNLIHNAIRERRRTTKKKKQNPNLPEGKKS